VSVFKQPVCSTVEYVSVLLKFSPSNVSYISLLKLLLRQFFSMSGICFITSLQFVEAVITSGSGVGVGVASLDMQLIVMLA